MKVLYCYGKDGKNKELILKGMKTSSWRQWCDATIREWEATLLQGGLFYLGKMNSSARHAVLRLLSVERGKCLDDLTMEDVRMEGGSHGTVRDFLTDNHIYFYNGDYDAADRTTKKFTKITFDLVASLVRPTPATATATHTHTHTHTQTHTHTHTHTLPGHDASPREDTPKGHVKTDTDSHCGGGHGRS